MPATIEKEPKVYTNQAVLYDPDREPLKPIAGARSARLFSVQWETGRSVQENGSNQQTIIQTSRIDFLPGINFVPTQTWDQIKDTTGVKVRVDCGSLRVLQPVRDGEISDTTAFSEQDARLMIASCWGAEDLENWARYERRIELRNLITERINKIKAGEIR